ncbi:MAG: hypothetical protein GXY81_06905 [Candidatus Cloacimonetes bacterium]|nr:hypothetical protein [Candidatus Cloacimonadota bacterium]
MKNHEIKENQDKTPDEQSAPETSPKAGKRVFWRPFLVAAGAVLLLILIAPLIPANENSIFSIKKFDLLAKLKGTGETTELDSVVVAARELQIDDELQALEPFLHKIHDFQKGSGETLRIAFYGDSIIEGDLLTETLRARLQEEYGGHGVGLVPITSIVSGFRQTIRHSFSKNWETVSFMKRGENRFPLGMIGYTFIPRTWYYEESVIETKEQPAVFDSLGNLVSAAVQGSSRKEGKRYGASGPSWVEYSGSKAKGGANDFRRIRLFYSHASANSKVTVNLDGGEDMVRSLTPGEGVQMLDLSPSSPVSKVRLTFSPTDPIHVYGVSFDDRSGLYVDNLSVRGYSGMYFDAIPASILSSFQRYLDYDLVVLQYGGNVSSPQTRDYSRYKNGMIQTVRHIQSAMPGVPILLIGVQDRSTNQGGVYQTAPDIPILVKAQSEMAHETGAAFWNLFKAMGGLNSMPTYVNARPQLAARDYTHFTRSGADKLAEMLHKVITTGRSD